MKLTWPMDGINEQGMGTKPGFNYVQGFGEHLLDYSQFGLKGHNGLDWAAPLGTPLLAVHDGNIQFLTENVDYGSGYGKNLRLYFDEEGYIWDCIYGHLQGYEGMPRDVKKGDVIGYVNSTGFSTGNHLHFGVRKIKNGVIEDYNNGYFGYIDPKPFFRKELMNQAKVVKSKNSPTVYICYPQTKMEVLKDNCETEGIILPEPIPDSDSL